MRACSINLLCFTIVFLDVVLRSFFPKTCRKGLSVAEEKLVPLYMLNYLCHLHMYKLFKIYSIFQDLQWVLLSRPVDLQQWPQLLLFMQTRPTLLSPIRALFKKLGTLRLLSHNSAWILITINCRNKGRSLLNHVENQQQQQFLIQQVQTSAMDETVQNGNDNGNGKPAGCKYIIFFLFPVFPPVRHFSPFLINIKETVCTYLCPSFTSEPSDQYPPNVPFPWTQGTPTSKT